MDYGIQVKSPKTKFFNLRKIAPGKKTWTKKEYLSKNIFIIVTTIINTNQETFFNRHHDYFYLFYKEKTPASVTKTYNKNLD